jgi:ribosomal protein S19E (S16A)
LNALLLGGPEQCILLVRKSGRRRELPDDPDDDFWFLRLLALDRHLAGCKSIMNATHDF